MLVSIRWGRIYEIMFLDCSFIQSPRRDYKNSWPNRYPKRKKIDPKTVFKNISQEIIDFPAFKGSPFKDFRNAIYHCQWTPNLPQLKLDQSTTNQLDDLHQKIGDWVNIEFKKCYQEFEKYYSTPPVWIYTNDGEEFMPECFWEIHTPNPFFKPTASSIRSFEVILS